MRATAKSSGAGKTACRKQKEGEHHVKSCFLLLFPYSFWFSRATVRTVPGNNKHGEKRGCFCAMARKQIVVSQMIQLARIVSHGNAPWKCSSAGYTAQWNR